MITFLAIVLLVIRLRATKYLWGVVKSQRELLNRPIIPPDVKVDIMRKDLYYLTIALLLSNVPAIVMDVFFFVEGVGFLDFAISTTSVLVFYTVSNATAAMLAAKIIAKIYADALEVDQTVEESDHTLMNDKKL